MASAADSIRLPDLITKWMEVQKSRVGLDDENPLRVDVIDLTLLLKSIGLKLEYLDFEPEKSNTDTLTIDIKCNRSGVMARLSYDLVDCSCPEKDDREASFWEVQATGPKVFSKHKNNTSSNLLPEVSENCSLVSKAMLSNLLDYYRTSINTIERGEDALHSPLRMAPPKICITSPATPPAEGKMTPRLGSSFSNQNNVNPAWSPMKTRSLDESLDTRSQESEEKRETKVNSSTTSIETRELCTNCAGDKPVKTVITTKEFTVSAMPDDSSFANSEAMRLLITSSPNEKDFNSPLFADQNHERDLNVIHCMQQARQQIDAALLIMRLNNPSRVVTGTSAVTTTPQTVVRKDLLQERSSSLSSINRRMSLPGRAVNLPKPPVNGTAIAPKKPVTVSKVPAVKQPLGARKDTPRPEAQILKCCPPMLRKAASITSVSTTAKTTSATVAKKPTTTAIKPINRSAITSKVNTGLAGRTINSSTINKK